MEENNIQEIEKAEVIESVEVNTQPQKKYTFRKLVATDIGLMTALIKNIGINKIASIFQNEDFKNAIFNNNENKTNDNNTMMTLGVFAVTELIQIILESYDKCENNLHKLLANTSNLSIEEVQGLGFDEFFDILVDFFKKDELMGFLNRVLKLLGLVD